MRAFKHAVFKITTTFPAALNPCAFYGYRFLAEPALNRTESCHAPEIVMMIMCIYGVYFHMVYQDGLASGMNLIIRMSSP